MMRAAAQLAAFALSLVALGCAVLCAPSPASFDASAPVTMDTALLQQFPALRLTDTAQFRILTDAGPSDVTRVRQQLEDLQTQFRQHFAPLIARDASAAKIRVVFFNRETDFRAYAQHAAPALAGGDGFFSSRENCLAILNQAGRTRVARAHEQIARRQQRVAQWTANSDQRLQASARLAEWRDTVDHEARAATDRLIRHEGAHRLFHVFGIESPEPVEPTWLTEGLAQYCEPPQIGGCHQPLVERLVAARRAGTLLPLHALLNHRDAAGFFALPADKIEIAYAESWALVYFLMQPPRREAFFEFIKHYRELRSPDTASLDLDPGWSDYINRL